MIAEEKFKSTLLSSFWLKSVIMAVGLLGAAAVAGLIVYLKRQVQRKTLHFNQVEPLKIKEWDLFAFLCLLALLLASPETQVFFNPVAILGITFILHSNQVYLPRFWGLRRFNLQQLIFLSIWLCLLVMLCLLPISLGVDWYSKLLHVEVKPQDSVNLLMGSQNKLELSLLLFWALFLVPSAEEILFRGFLYPYLKSRIPAIAALVLVSLLFAFIHFHLFTFLQLFFLAVILTAIFEHTGSLPLCIGLHMAFNACNAIWLLFLKYLP